jgi:hypothetical protein
MIAEACVATHLPPEAFGVASSPELGDVLLEVLIEQGKDAERAARKDELRRRRLA